MFFVCAASEPRKNCGIKRKKSENDENDSDYDDIAEAEDDAQQVKVEDTVIDDHVESVADTTRQTFDI